MKVFASIALASLIAASAAQAEVKVEPRVFHNNLRLDASKAASAGRTQSVRAGYFNTVGAGVNGIYSSDANVDIGLGYSFARYYVDTSSQMDQHTVSAFARYNFIKSENGAFYGLLGVSNVQLDRHFETYSVGAFTQKASMTFDPLLNGDVGLGGSIKLGAVDLGLEYKYSNTLSKSSATVKSRESLGSEVRQEQARFTGMTAEEQEISLTLGFSI